MRHLENEFGESTNSIRIELNRFEKAGLLNTSYKGNKKYFQANTEHPLFPAINNLLMKHIGFDKIIDTVVKKLGEVKSVFIVGDFAKGIDNKIIDLLFIGQNININFLVELIEKAEKLIKRKIRYLIYSEEEFKEEYYEKKRVVEPLLLWKKEE